MGHVPPHRRLLYFPPWILSSPAVGTGFFFLRESSDPAPFQARQRNPRGGGRAEGRSGWVPETPPPGSGVPPEPFGSRRRRIFFVYKMPFIFLFDPIPSSRGTPDHSWVDVGRTPPCPPGLKRSPCGNQSGIHQTFATHSMNILEWTKVFFFGSLLILGMYIGWLGFSHYQTQGNAEWKNWFKMKKLCIFSQINTSSFEIWCILVLYRKAPKKIFDTFDFLSKNHDFPLQI